MIRAHRVAATAQDDASLISGWNIAPNVAYSVALTPGATSCGVFLFAASGALVASGAALVGTEQPCVLIPQSGQTIGMIDAELGWHLTLTTIGTELQRTIRINPAVDLPDEIHPIYGEDGMALVRATAGIDGASHYFDDLIVTCPLGLGAGLGDVASVPVDGSAVVGQVESITWTGTPNGASEQAVIRRHVAIAPAPAVAPPAPPVVANDTGATDAATTTSGNVLANDASGLTVTAVNGLSASVGVDVAGNNGGLFAIDANGAWTFDPDGDFSLLTGSETADTSVAYHASDGVAEASATLTITVSAAASSTPWTPAEITGAVWVDADAATLDGTAVTTLTDKKGGTITATQGTPANRPTLVTDVLNGQPVIQFDGNDWLSFGTAMGKPANFTVFVVGMFASMGAKVNMCGSGNSAGASATYWGDIGVGRTANDGKIEYFFSDGPNYSFGRSTNAVITSGNWFLCCRRYTNGQDRVVDRVNGTSQSVTKNDGTATSNGGTAFQYSLGRSGEWNGQYFPSGSRLKGFVCAPSAISDADAARLEGYYAHLCGLASLLPSGHPYKSAPPYVE
jgi:VCBS repeat-containing protein